MLRMIKVDQLKPIEYKGVRVLMGSQLAEVYGTDAKTIRKNFERNEKRYSKEKHYFLLTGDDLRDFKASRHNDVSPNLNKLYLWTEKGALLHAKSLGTNQAWDTYEALVDKYYDVKEQLDELTSLARRNGFATFAQFNENRFSVGRTIKTFRDCTPRELIGIAEDFRDYVGQLDAETRINRCNSAIKGLEERYNKSGYSEAYRIIADVMRIQHTTKMRSQAQQHRREKERMTKGC